jgi:23S rRNA-/tRNA-specific pseudouridylate synthase
MREAREQLSVLPLEIQKRIDDSFYSCYWRWEIGEGESVEGSVDAELAKRLPHIDPSSWTERFELGGVYVAGEPAAFGMSIPKPCRLEYYEPKQPLEQLPAFYPTFSAQQVIYRDEDIAVVCKPSGLPTTAPRDQQRYHLLAQVEEYFGVPVHTPSRLDIPVSGLVLCSFSSRMNRYLQKAYSKRWIEKYYLAEVVGCPEWETRVCTRAIERDPRHPVLRRCTSRKGRGEHATTEFTRLCSYIRDDEERTLLQAQPLTGRTHQIRLHCMSEGFPIVGDPYYGGIEAPQLLLTSYALRLFNPFIQKTLYFQVPADLLPTWLRGLPLLDVRPRIVNV